MGASIPIQILRWIAVLPGSFLSAVIVSFPIHWLVMLIGLFGRASDDAFVSIDGKTPLAAIPPEILERFGYAFFVPLTIIIVGAIIAPKFKFYVGIVLSILWVSLLILGLIIASHLVTFEWTWFRVVVSCILNITGMGLGLFIIYSKQPKNSEGNPGTKTN